ncbi:MAG: hypothetical protein H5U02_11075 [Clostridia bacterium]|nr:hypothetical protein [Clostridia bacterium]
MAKKIPEFKTEREEANYWDTHSLADHWDALEPVDVELDSGLEAKVRARALKRVTLRLRPTQIQAVKEIARKKDIPYQTLIRSWVAEAIERERRQDRSPT